MTIPSQISGETPDIFDRFKRYLDVHNFEKRAGPLVTNAIKTITADSEVQPKDVTAIGTLKDHRNPLQWGGAALNSDTLHLPDSSLRVIPHCTTVGHGGWGVSVISAPNPEDIIQLVCGETIMAQTTSLVILSLATEGRVSPKRLWRLVVHQELSRPVLRDFSPWSLRIPRSSIQGLSYRQVIALRSLGDIELIKNTIIHEGKFWMSMRTDCFPLHPNVGDPEMPPIYINLPSASNALCIMEKVPLEIMTEIMSHLSLVTVLSLLSTSRHLRSKHLGFASERDALARAFIRHTAPWYQIPNDKIADGEARMLVGWEYLRRCSQSGSMRNRRRIWQNAEQIEKLCDQAGI